MQGIIERNERLLREIKDALQARKSGLYYWFKKQSGKQHNDELLSSTEFNNAVNQLGIRG
jgi:hypothetical protein